jgi:hypothetical protein
MRSPSRIGKLCALVALLALAASLTGCTPQVSAGVVTAKNHYDAYDTTALVPIYHTVCTTTYVNDEPETSCTQQVLYYQSVTTHHPERWTVTLEAGAGKQGKTNSSEVEVSSATWNQIHLGDNYDSVTGVITPQ